MNYSNNCNVNMNYIQYIKQKIDDPCLVDKYRINTADFSRARKLPFNTMIKLLMFKSEHTITSRMHLALDSGIFETLADVPTSSAFSQRREKIDPNVFVELLNLSNLKFYQNADNAYHIRDWKGHSVIAIDGSRFTMPKTPENNEIYSLLHSRNLKEGVLQGHSIHSYDPLNHLPLKSTIGKFEAEKNPFLKEHLPYIKEGVLSEYLKDPILVFDRLFIDFSMFVSLAHQDLKFCIRSKTSATFKVITNFVKSAKKDAILTFRCPDSQKQFVERNNLPKVIKLRAVKVLLSTGELEILITNLFDNEKYSPNDLKVLYFLRWGVEVAFYFQKVFMSIENFSSEKNINILQDFHSQIFLYAFCEMLKIEEDKKIDAIARANARKHKYQVGIANLITAVQNFLGRFLSWTQEKLVQAYYRFSAWVQANSSPIRPNRHEKRPHQSDSTSLVYRITKKRAYS